MTCSGVAGRRGPQPQRRRRARGASPIAVNAKVEKITGAYWKPLLRAGRGIVCASGWYEWTGGERLETTVAQTPQEPRTAVHLRLGQLRASQGKPRRSRLRAGDGYSLGGIVDIHERRPVVVSADDARRWLDPALSPDEAARLARTCMLNAELFEWRRGYLSYSIEI